jgi:glycosyltransferase involved in cell wall biosynthesis
MQPVSIVATVLNEAEDIGRVVPALLAQVPPAAEVIVVDGGSTDGTWEWLEAAAASDSRLVAIRDETCSLKFSPGPISRGRNVAIAAARSGIIACADAGCTYAPDWQKNLTAPLIGGAAEYALGGSCLDANRCTVWDVAAASFLGVKLTPVEPTKSCTARSMAFTKELWKQIGGFPEHLLNGEDTVFDLEARKRATPAFVADAKAFYGPRSTFRSACSQLALYAACDGKARVRLPRFLRNAARCVAAVLALLCLRWSVAPLLVILALQVWFAFYGDWQQLVRFGAKAVLARFVFSVAVPWVVAVNQIRGCFTKEPLTNRQNTGNSDRGSGNRKP